MRDSQTDFRSRLQSYFCNYLIIEKNVSDKTVSSYRDVFRLFFQFWKNHTKVSSDFSFSEFNALLVADFLKHLESVRKNSPCTRNQRLAGIHSFAEYVAMNEPRYAGQMQAILAIPTKRHEKKLLGFLDTDEIEVLINAPLASTWSGRRDRVMFRLVYNSGARISEAVAVRVNDLELKRQPSVKLHGKGRKERVIPLWKETAVALREWINENTLADDAPLFPNFVGGVLSRSGAEKRLKSAVKIASSSCPSLKGKRVSPHILRHSTAMHMLQSGVDITLIALWLGHSSITTTHGYIEADLAMKEKTLAAVKGPKKSTCKYKPTEELLSFLDSL